MLLEGHLKGWQLMVSLAHRSTCPCLRPCCPHACSEAAFLVARMCGVIYGEFAA